MMHLCNPAVTEAFWCLGMSQGQAGTGGFSACSLFQSLVLSFLLVPALFRAPFPASPPLCSEMRGHTWQVPTATGVTTAHSSAPLAALCLSPIPSLLLHQREQGQRQPVLLYDLHSLYFLSYFFRFPALFFSPCDFGAFAVKASQSIPGAT